VVGRPRSSRLRRAVVPALVSQAKQWARKRLTWSRGGVYQEGGEDDEDEGDVMSHDVVVERMWCGDGK
jgi:hypothetical protein